MKVKPGSGLVDLKCNTAIGGETRQYCHIHKVLCLSKVVMNGLRWENLRAKDWLYDHTARLPATNIPEIYVFLVIVKLIFWECS